MDITRKKVELIRIPVEFDGAAVAVKGDVVGVVSEVGEMAMEMHLDVSYNDQIFNEKDAMRQVMLGILEHYLQP